MIESVAKEKCLFIGMIGHYFPANVWISEKGKRYVTHEYKDDIRNLDNVFSLIEYELKKCDFSSVAMKSISKPD